MTIERRSRVEGITQEGKPSSLLQSPGEYSDLEEQLLEIHWLGYVRVEACLGGALSVLLARESGEGQCWNTPRRAKLLFTRTYGAHQNVPIFATQPNIADDDIGHTQSESLLRRGRGLNRMHFGSLCLEQ